MMGVAFGETRAARGVGAAAETWIVSPAGNVSSDGVGASALLCVCVLVTVGAGETL